MRNAIIYYNDQVAGDLSQHDEGYTFQYRDEYLALIDAKPISLTLPLSSTPFKSKTLFPFFDGLIPEGWLLDIAQRNWKLDARDRMGLLMTCCQECIGAVRVLADEKIPDQ